MDCLRIFYENVDTLPIQNVLFYQIKLWNINLDVDEYYNNIVNSQI